MDGITTLAEHQDPNPFNGFIPSLNGIGLGVQVTMTPQHAAALMHHLSTTGAAIPIGPTPNGILKFGKNVAIRDQQQTATITPLPPQMNGNPQVPQPQPQPQPQTQSQISSQPQSAANQPQQQQHSPLPSNALVPVIDGAVVNGGSSAGEDSGRSTPTNNNIADANAAAKLFVGGLSWTTSNDNLRKYFSMFGSVIDVLIMRDPVTQRSRGFGFIQFADADTVDKVLKVPIHTLDGKKIDPKHATPKSKPRVSNKTKKIFVGGVSQDTTQDEVRAYFSQFGRVEDTVMLMDQQTKRHRGFGFVTFENEDIVDTICEIHFHTIKNKKVECKKAQPKELIQPSLLLGKRMILNNPLGVRIATTPAATATAIAPPVNQFAALQVQTQAAAAAVAAQNAAAAATYGKILGYPSLAGYRYAPYQVPTLTANPGTNMVSTGAPSQASVSVSGQCAPTTSMPSMTTAAYPTAFTNIDMSAFPGFDWASLYGMGMYV